MLTAFLGLAAAVGCVGCVRYYRLWRDSVGRELRIWQATAAALAAAKREDGSGRRSRPAGEAHTPVT